MAPEKVRSPDCSRVSLVSTLCTMSTVSIVSPGVQHDTGGETSPQSPLPHAAQAGYKVAVPGGELMAVYFWLHLVTIKERLYLGFSPYNLGLPLHCLQQGIRYLLFPHSTNPTPDKSLKEIIVIPKMPGHIFCSFPGTPPQCAGCWLHSWFWPWNISTVWGSYTGR